MSELSLGKNVVASQDGDKLTLVIDLSKSFGLSKSGKTTIIATTSGAAKLPDDTAINLNVYRK